MCAHGQECPPPTLTSERPTTIGGPPPIWWSPPPQDQRYHSRKKRNLQSGKAVRAIFGTHKVLGPRSCPPLSSLLMLACPRPPLPPKVSKGLSPQGVHRALCTNSVFQPMWRGLVLSDDYHPPRSANHACHPLTSPQKVTYQRTIVSVGMFPHSWAHRPYNRGDCNRTDPKATDHSNHHMQRARSLSRAVSTGALGHQNPFSWVFAVGSSRPPGCLPRECMCMF